MRALRAAGVTVKEICYRLRVERVSVTKYTVDIRPSHRAGTVEDKCRLLALAGKSPREIAATVNRRVNHVRVVLSRLRKTDRLPADVGLTPMNPPVQIPAFPPGPGQLAAGDGGPFSCLPGASPPPGATDARPDPRPQQGGRRSQQMEA